MHSFIPVLLFSVTASFAASSIPGPKPCPRWNGVVLFGVVLQSYMDRISELKVTESYSEDTMTHFLMKIQKTQTTPQCVSRQHRLLFEEVGCTISTARIDIFLHQMVKDIVSADGRWYQAEAIQIAISGAVLNATLNETAAEGSAYYLRVITLVGLSIQDLTSIIQAQKSSLPATHENHWKTWAIENTERLLRRAFLAHRVLQCGWQ